MIETARASGGPAAGEDSRRPGRPRDRRVDEAVLTAVVDLLVEGTSVEALSIESVAARAGVGKAAIYRRWPGKDALLVDAVGRIKGRPPSLVGDSVRADLLRLLRPAKPPDERLARVMSCLVPELRRSPERYRLYQNLVEPRREAVRQVLRRGIRTGELRPDIDVEVAVMVLSAPVLVQRMTRWHPGLGEADLPERVVDLVLAGLAAR